MAYRIAAHLSSKDLTRVDGASQFARAIADLFAKIRPTKLVETGTYRGTGTTSIIAGALRDLQLDGAARFFSIECNPENSRRALQHLMANDLKVTVLTGLSVPRRLLPSIDQIEQAVVKTVAAPNLIVDHEEADRAARYFAETDFPDLPDDLLGAVLREFAYAPDFVLLDSAGHMGHVEFQYLLGKLRGPCHIALDDVQHVKHYRSFSELRGDARFEIVVESPEKFGFCIAKFTPAASAQAGEDSAAKAWAAA